MQIVFITDQSKRLSQHNTMSLQVTFIPVFKILPLGCRFFLNSPKCCCCTASADALVYFSSLLYYKKIKAVLLLNLMVYNTLIFKHLQRTLHTTLVHEFQGSVCVVALV